MADETEGIALHRPTVEQGVLAVFDDARKGAYWIAEVDGEPAGCLLTVPEWERLAQRNRIVGALGLRGSRGQAPGDIPEDV